MADRPRVVGIRGFSPTPAAIPSERDFEFVRTYVPPSSPAVSPAPPLPKNKGFLARVLPWLFR